MHSSAENNLNNQASQAQNSQTPSENPAEEALVRFGSSVKAIGEDGKIGGYLVVFSGPDDPDLQGEFFTKDTNFGEHTSVSIRWAHGLDPEVGTKSIGIGSIVKDAIGVWIEGVLNLRDAYEKAIYEMAKAGKLGWSSGSAPNLIEREMVGKAVFIKSWPLGLDASLTPIPCEPRTHAMPLKSLEDEILNIKQGKLHSDLTKEVANKMPRGHYYVDMDQEFAYSTRYEGDSDDYHAHPYKMGKDGSVTMGDPIPAKRKVTYEVAGKETKSLTMTQHENEVLATVFSFKSRLDDLAGVRNASGRLLGPKFRSEAKSVADSIIALIQSQTAPEDELALAKAKALALLELENQ